MKVKSNSLRIKLFGLIVNSKVLHGGVKINDITQSFLITYLINDIVFIFRNNRTKNAVQL